MRKFDGYMTKKSPRRNFLARIFSFIKSRAVGTSRAVMAGNIINRLSNAISRIEQAIGIFFGHRFPPGAIGAFAHDFDGSATFGQQVQKSAKPFSLKDLMDDGFLWGVPKHRRSLEKRMSRRFGFKDHGRVWKMLEPKTNLLMCIKCGHDYEAHTICGHCYAKIKGETTLMQEEILKKLKLDPVEKDVIVIYEGEKENVSAEFWKGQRLVEMPKKRPQWFHSNLTQSTTQQPSESKEVKPIELA